MICSSNFPMQLQVMAMMFYEASTRTTSSFSVAMQLLGGIVQKCDPDTSSLVKGETLSGTQSKWL